MLKSIMLWSQEVSPMQLRRPQFTLCRAMVTVACLAICLAGLRVILNLPSGGIPIPKYDETKFESLRAGMTGKEVEAIMGEPLDKIPWNQHMGVHDEEMWLYIDQANASAEFWRCGVHFRDGKMQAIISDFRYD
jgi:hypothetical protein